MLEEALRLSETIGDPAGVAAAHQNLEVVRPHTARTQGVVDATKPKGETV